MYGNAGPICRTHMAHAIYLFMLARIACNISVIMAVETTMMVALSPHRRCGVSTRSVAEAAAEVGRAAAPVSNLYRGVAALVLLRSPTCSLCRSESLLAKTRQYEER